MTNDLRSVLEKVFPQVLEDYAFMFGDVLEEGAAPAPDGACIAARMKFAGPFQGHLALSAPESFCRQLAANVLGLEMEDAEVESGAADSLKELLNVVCGNLLTELAGDEPVFDLTIPEVVPLSEEDWEVSSLEGVGFLVEEWPVFLDLTCEGSCEQSGCGCHEPQS